MLSTSLTSHHTTTSLFSSLSYYELKLLGLSNRTTLVLSNTRELDRELFYKLVYLYSPTGGPC